MVSSERSYPQKNRITERNEFHIDEITVCDRTLRDNTNNRVLLYHVCAIKPRIMIIVQISWLERKILYSQKSRHYLRDPDYNREP